MISLDTEDDSCGTVKIINFFDGQDHITFTGPNLQYRAWGWLQSVAPETVWCTQTEYDLINLFGPWLGRFTTLQYVKAGLMRATFRLAKIVFLDTLRHWPASVEKMGEAIGLEKLSMPHLGCDCDDCVYYCRRDSEITWRYTDAMCQRYRDLGLDSIRSTLPSMALQLFKQFYAKDFPEIPSYIKKQMRRGYYGGRVEIYQMGKIEGPINHYDVNSLFPSCMVDFSYPDVSSLRSTTSPDFQKEGVFEGWVLVSYNDYPTLPVRDEEILFPHGNLYGAWCYPEIRQVLKDGGKIISCKEAVEFDEVENPFDNYVKFCYGKRLNSKDGLDSQFWKLMLNSLYGKFGSHNEITTIFDDEERAIGGESRTANVIWAAYVTSYARLRLLEFLRSAGSNYYTDTDSLFTLDTLPTSTRIGELKLEGIYKTAEFRGNKLYVLDSVARAKGVPRNKAQEFFDTGKTSYKKPARFREARRTSKQANYWYDQEKHNNQVYTKRKILDSGKTVPWEFGEYKIFKERLELKK